LREKAPYCRFYFAASSEMFGNARETPQNENTPFYPRSSYVISKLAGFHLTRNYREAYNLFALSGICFNHESPRRGFEFITRKVTNAVAKISLGLEKELRVGNLEARRDWGYAADYVGAMWLMLQQDTPEDYVIATGTTYSVKELLELVFRYVGLNWKDYVVVDQDLYRPAEAYELRGDSSKARNKLDWEPTASFEQVIKMMVDEDIKRLKDQECHIPLNEPVKDRLIK
jgi:GDPmannose 4,6-dehydratase